MATILEVMELRFCGQSRASSARSEYAAVRESGVSHLGCTATPDENLFLLGVEDDMTLE